MAKKATKKAPAAKKEKAVNDLKQFRVHTEEKSILVDAKNESEAEQTASVLLLQHGEYSNENPPVITEVEEVE